MKQIIAIAIVAVLVVMGGGFVFLSQRDAGQEAPAPADGAPQVATAEDAVPVAAREPVATREKEFEDILNNFLTQINDQVRDYRTERKILGELVKPENLLKREYVEQNYEVLKATIPALQLKIRTLMNVFEVTEAEIETKLEGQPADYQATILQQWKTLKDRQASLYVDFFAIEQELLQAYDNLMSFYYERREMYTVDPDTLKMNFVQSEDEQSAMEFRAKILELAAREATLLDKQTP